MHRNAQFRDKKIKKFCGGAQLPPQILPRWGGDTPSPNPPLGACGASTSPPPFTNPGSALGYVCISVLLHATLGLIIIVILFSHMVKLTINVSIGWMPWYVLRRYSTYADIKRAVSSVLLVSVIFGNVFWFTWLRF